MGHLELLRVAAAARLTVSAAHDALVQALAFDLQQGRAIRREQFIDMVRDLYRTLGGENASLIQSYSFRRSMPRMAPGRKACYFAARPMRKFVQLGCACSSAKSC